MEFALNEEPGSAVNGQPTECSAKLESTNNNKSLCMKRTKTSRESEIYLYNSGYLKNNYDKYIRDDFLYAFGAFYCDKVMKIPHLDCVLKTECYHHETKLNYRHYEFATYMENIVSWLDFKLKYINSESSKCNKKTVDQLFKTNYTQQNTTDSTESSLHCKILDSNTYSQEQNKKLRSVTNSPNEIMVTSDIIIPKQDFSENSTNDYKNEITMQNTQNELIISPEVTSPKYNYAGSSPNNYKKTIDMVNNTQNKKITLSDFTSPKHNTPGSSSNDHKKEVNMVNNIQNKGIVPVLTSPKHNSLGSLPNNHKKQVDMVNNIQNKSIIPDLTSPKHDTPESSPNDHKKKVNMVKNTQNKRIRLSGLTSSKHNTPRSPSNDHKKEVDMVNNTQNKKITMSGLTSPKHDTLGNSCNDHKKQVDMVNNTQNKRITLSDLTSPKHNTPGSSPNDHKKEVHMVKNIRNKRTRLSGLTSSKHDTPPERSNGHKKEVDMINSNLVNISSTADSILITKSQLKNSDITVDEKTSTSDNLKNNIKDKVVNESKLNSVQKSSAGIIGEEISNLCLETPTTVRHTRQTNKKLDKTSTTLLKRSNSVINSEQSSKKKKIEKPSPINVEGKINTNINKNSVKALNESTKQVSKHLYSRNSKGETKLHSACAKGKLSLVISLLEDGFNPNVKDNAGWTPMHEAVKSGNLDIVKELIKYGAYLNVPGFEYESPLYTAIKYSKFEIAKTILDYGADANFINMYGNNARCLNKEKLSELMENQVSCISPQIDLINYKSDEIVIVLNNISLKSATVNTFCKQFNIKLVQNVLDGKKFAQVTHMIVSKTKNNTCDVNLECLFSIANGLFIINENWISDSLDKNKLMECEKYEVSGTTFFADCNGPKISRISKQKLYPKLFDGISIHICGSNGWNQFTLEHLKKLVVEFGAKLLIRMPNPEDCPTNIIPYHCRNNDQMFHVSNIILYTIDSNRLIKYNMKHLKAFHISWFMDAIQKYII
ncbi:BRCA1-associated RING domain protein 1-like isoform X2 [Melanaphis sacchari]|uniref:BRCA1-associated RING domain protein 1-like isoform X2 n=1 Tax=Melanaphis sacchari TaxID=742174 RepID=UPI000DC137CE|nr:BRCA1-associated RING domain protein 1-like isoform X2 [Melanaphis sacchari]